LVEQCMVIVVTYEIEAAGSQQPGAAMVPVFF
jgi:hypothetical protein